MDAAALLDIAAAAISGASETLTGAVLTAALVYFAALQKKRPKPRTVP
jgi:hypothetical protein